MGFVLEKKQACKPDSVSPRDPYHLSGCNITVTIYLPTPRHRASSPTIAGIHDISPHRVYLVSLQHYLYILSVALVLPRVLHTLVTGITRYAALWCPDFPPFLQRAIRRPAARRYCKIYDFRFQISDLASLLPFLVM